MTEINPFLARLFQVGFLLFISFSLNAQNWWDHSKSVISIDTLDEDLLEITEDFHSDKLRKTWRKLKDFRMIRKTIIGVSRRNLQDKSKPNDWTYTLEPVVDTITIEKPVPLGPARIVYQFAIVLFKKRHI